MKQLHKNLRDAQALLDMSAADIGEIFHKTLNHLIAKKILPVERLDEVEQALLEREAQVPTAIGNGVAIPHAYLDAFAEPVVVFVRLKHPLNLGAPDGVPTRFLFVLMGPNESASQHLDTLTSIARLAADDEFRYEARRAHDATDIDHALDRFEQRSLKPITQVTEKLTEGLEYTGRFGGGLMDDFRRRMPHYVSDFKDGLNLKTFSSTLFLFFACLAPAVIFGGLMSVETGHRIGVVEMILATTVCGIVYSLFSGQPLIILGGTGPLLVFTGILYKLCHDYEIPFLETYAWIGLWTSLFLLILSVTDGSCLMRFFTRFTDEIFAALISVIFIIKAVTGLFGYFTDTEIAHDGALLGVLLALATFYLSITLSQFRNSRYMSHYIREFLADFGPAISLIGIATVGYFLVEYIIPEVTIPSLLSAEKAVFKPTLEGREWMLDLFRSDLKTSIRYLTCIPAILVTVLVYIDQNISARLVNSPDHKLQKGPAYHWDLALLAILVAFCSLFGLPWLVAATVRSLNHVRSLATSEEVRVPGGETKERIIHVNETRMTGLAIHILIGLSLLFMPLMQYIPMAVLYGLFLFMGVVSIAGNQFFERMSLWLMDSSLYPSTHYTRQVPRRRIHYFTLIQFACFVILWFVMSSPLDILFPLFLLLLVPVRLVVGRWFSQSDLDALDAEEDPEEEDEHWA